MLPVLAVITAIFSPGDTLNISDEPAAMYKELVVAVGLTPNSI
jgi:hypothetical protein